MTIEGAIAQLQELIDNDGIPFWAKPSLQKVMETVEMEREQRIEESKTGKWIRTDKAIRIVRKYLGYSDEKPYDTVDAIVDDIMDEADKEGAEE